MTQRVIVHTECHARGNFSYTKPTIGEALDIFFDGEDPDTFFDRDAEEAFTREDAEATFAQEREVTFYNSEGEQTRIVLDIQD